MSFIGSLHELSLYGLVAAIICLLRRDISLQLLWQAAFHPTGLMVLSSATCFGQNPLFNPAWLSNKFCSENTTNF